MTDYNSMKADEYAQRLGEMDEFDNQVERISSELISQLPEWIEGRLLTRCEISAIHEARRRVMQAIKERNEP